MQPQTVATVVLLCLHLLLRVSRLLSRSARAVMRLTDAPHLVPLTRDWHSFTEKICVLYKNFVSYV